MYKTKDILQGFHILISFLQEVTFMLAFNQSYE